jgi:cytochrome c556
MKFSRFSGAFAAAVAILVAGLAVPRAQQPQPPQQQTPAAPAQPPATPPAPASQAKPFVPLAASTLAAHPETYYGETVTVTAAVEQTMTKSAFSIDQDKTKSTGKEILVLAPTMTGTVDLNTYVTVIGEVMAFDPAEIAKKAKGYTIDISPETAAKYKGRPVVLATAVVNSAGIDVAKKPLPPMTADDLALQKLMKQVGPANTALRGDIDKMDAALTKEHATVLKQAFTQTEAFWKTKGKTDAIQWALDARKDAEALEAAVTAGNWDQAKASAGTLGQKCAACHGAYRDRLDDGTFRIKTGSR